MKEEKFIIDAIIRLAGKYSVYQVFSDWVMMTATSIQNACVLQKDIVYETRENNYKMVTSKYNKDELELMCRMTAELVRIFETRFGDVLGEIYMKAGCGSNQTGQFFTPYHISYMLASLSYEKQKEQEKYIINEPSTGGGSSIIAFAQVLKENGVDYQKKMEVVAQDLDWNAVYMTYIQLSLLGINATVIQGDTLAADKPNKLQVLNTPRRVGVLL